MGSSKHTVSRSRTTSRDWDDDDLGDTTGEWETTTPHDPDTPVEQTFLLRIRDQPDDVGMRMVFADWLEERGHVHKAEFLRLVMQREPDQTVVPKVEERMRALAALLPPVWRAIVTRTRIEKCSVNFKLKCPRMWEALAGTDESSVRHCSACARNVYFCTTLAEVASHGRQGNCVAFCTSLVRERALDEYDGDEVEMGEIAYVDE